MCSTEFLFMAQTNSFVKTGVDNLIDLLKSVERISVDDAAKKLKISTSLVQRWIDLLVEEHIIGIEYKFITPYIFLIKKKGNDQDLYQNFHAKASAKGIDPQRIDILWKQYLLNHTEIIQKDFYAKALRRGYDPDKIDSLWAVYHKKLLFPDKYVERKK